MNRIKKLILFLVVLISPLFIVSHGMAELVNDLNDGQHVLLMRHADAPGFGDPAGYVLGKCSTQRNLGERGRKQANSIGVWLNNQGIKSAEVFSSPWCRCLDTATILNKGSVKIEPSLGSFFDDMSLEKKQTQALKVFIQNELAKQNKRPLILVTHHVNIEAYTGKVVGVGDMVLVRVGKNGEYLSHIIYPSPKY